MLGKLFVIILCAGAVLAPVLSGPDVVAEEKLDSETKHTIHHECKRLIYTFLDYFEDEHSNIADLMTKDGEAFGAKGRDAIRKTGAVIEKQAVIEVNALVASNLLIDIQDATHATAKCYIEAYQYNYENAEREGQAVLELPNTLTVWHWEFELEDEEWKISKMSTELVLLNKKMFRYLPEDQR